MSIKSHNTHSTFEQMKNKYCASGYVYMAEVIFGPSENFTIARKSGFEEVTKKPSVRIPIK